jgi:hypothetical protein
VFLDTHLTFVFVDIYVPNVYKKKGMSLEDFFQSYENAGDGIDSNIVLTAEEVECTNYNLYKYVLEELKNNLFMNLEKETGVGLFDLKSVITSSNVINVDYLLLVRALVCIPFCTYI